MGCRSGTTTNVPAETTQKKQAPVGVGSGRASRTADTREVDTLEEVRRGSPPPKEDSEEAVRGAPKLATGKLGRERWIKAFTTAFNRKSPADMSDLFMESGPVVVLRNRGVRVTAERYDSARDALDSLAPGRIVFEVPVPKSGALPGPDCDAIDPRGAVHGPVSDATLLIKRYGDAVSFLNGDDRALALKLSARTTYFFYSKSDNVGFFFAFGKAGVRLTGIDLVVPCSA